MKQPSSRLLLPLLAALAVAPSHAQQSPPAQAPSAPAETAAPQEEFFESIEVNLVNVEVYVTDKKGNRIPGLGKDDFQLFEDGKPVQITNFYAVE